MKQRLPDREKCIFRSGSLLQQSTVSLAKSLQEGVLEHVEEVHIALLETDTEVFIRPVGVMDEDLYLDIFFDAFLKNVFQTGENVRVVGAEAAPGAFCFQQVFGVQIHDDSFQFETV